MVRRSILSRCAFIILGTVLFGQFALAQETAAKLPDSIRAIWDLDRAFRETTPTRERICINGLWRWQPATSGRAVIPSRNWGWFKVPGCWPGISDYLQQDCQTLYIHPTWRDVKPGSVTGAWCQREITIPPAWAGRRIALSAEYVNSFAAIYIDDKHAADLRFPGGEADITSFCRPGTKQLLSIYVVAMPLKAVMASFADTAAEKQKAGSVERRGLCGDGGIL